MLEALPQNPASPTFATVSRVIGYFDLEHTTRFYRHRLHETEVIECLPQRAVIEEIPLCANPQERKDYKWRIRVEGTLIRRESPTGTQKLSQPYTYTVKQGPIKVGRLMVGEIPFKYQDIHGNIHTAPFTPNNNVEVEMMGLGEIPNPLPRILV